MIDYKGKKCIVCDREFAEGDDIVVCPDCGTPYHRACYTEKGECINYSLHENGGSWSADQKAKEAAERNGGESVKCARCGGENPADALFCNYCGLPLGIQQGAQQSFNDNPQGMRGQRTQGQDPYGNPQNPYGGFGNPMFGMQTQRFTADSDIDGNTLGEYAGYVGTNRGYFMTQFIRFAKFAKKASFSFVAFLFPEFYFFYRKMYIRGFLMALAMFVLSVPSLVYMFQENSDYVKLLGSGLTVLTNNINVNSRWFANCYNICYFGSWALQIVCGLFANFWYYRKAKNDIDGIKANGGDSGAIVRKGGTSTGVLILSFVIYMALSVLALIAVHFRTDILQFF